MCSPGVSAAPLSPAAAQLIPAQLAPAQVPAAPSTTTLPLFGAPLTIDVTAAPGGAIASVSVDPADGLTASTVKPNKVKFVNEDGTARVQVSTRHGGERIEARAGTLVDVSGPGSWSGDLFGTGTITTVDFEVGATADGGPDILDVTTSDATAQVGAVDYDDDGDRARVSIEFTDGIERRWLSIRVSVKSWDDRPGSDDASSNSSARVSIALSDVKGERLPAAEVVGPQAWNGVLCDGTPAQIDYTVNADGTVSGVTASPATAEIEIGERGVRVGFSENERVKIRVKSSDDGAEMKVAVDEKIWCDNADPTVNTPVDEDIDDGHDGDRRDGDGRDGDGRDGRDGRTGDGRGGESDDGNRDD
jgi:hypothetical protein